MTNAETDPDLLNYYNYFTEVEEEFVRRRGKPLLISPMDWALVESWKSMGIPLHVVLRGINEAFDAWDAKPRKYRKVNNIFYCEQAVESNFADYMLAQVGAPAAEEPAPEAAPAPRGKSLSGKRSNAPSKQALLAFLGRSRDELAAAGETAKQTGRGDQAEAIGRACDRLNEISAAIQGAANVDAEALERDLDAIDRLILDALTQAAGESGIAAIRSEAEGQLAAYRKKMDNEIYGQTLQNFVCRRLREMSRVPRLSLFYL